MQRNILIIGSNGYVSAIAGDTGNEIWRLKLKKGFFGGSTGQEVSVLLDDDKVFAGCSGRIYCLDVLTGNVIWQNEMNGLGFNAVSLARQGVHTQFITKIESSG